MNNTNKMSNQDNNVVTRPERNRIIINVDRDFDGDLEEAIATAEDGDIIKLGNNTYETSGINLEHDITIDGQPGSVIDGGGTLEPIFSLTPEASGATIRDLEITNGNVGIHGDGATDITLKNLNINNIGIEETIRDGQHNIGINLLHADGFRIFDSEIHDIGRKGVGINDTDGGIISGLVLREINLDAEHAQSFDAAGIKLFNTNDVEVRDNELFEINAFNIWNDLTSGTIIEGNDITGVGDVFVQPDFNQNVTVSGIYNEKSYNSIVEDNDVDSVGNFLAFDATVFTTETMILRNNNFSSFELNTEDYWANEQAERLVAITEDPDEADFSSFEEDFFAEANIGSNSP